MAWSSALKQWWLYPIPWSTKTTGNGKVYFSHRPVRSRCDGNKVRQKILLSLGSDFAVDLQNWAAWARALGELLGVDFETMRMMRLYRASDALMPRHRAIKEHLFGLVNTFFEGAAAKRGHSKERLSDCPLLDPVLDSGGFAGIEDTTLAAMLSALEVSPVAMESGAATDDVIWLRGQPRACPTLRPDLAEAIVTRLARRRAQWLKT